MYLPPHREFEIDATEGSPIRGLLIAAPIAGVLWFALYEAVRTFV